MIHSIPRPWLIATLFLCVSVIFAVAYGVDTGSALATDLPHPLLQSGLVPLENIERIEAHRYHTCALTTAGGVKCWGNNENGRLGVGDLSKRTLPTDVVGLTSGVKLIESGGQHTCVVTTGGGVKCWGQNLYGQLGNGNTTDQTSPVDVVGLSSGVTAVAAGGSTTCALLTTGGVKCWGDNTFGQIGDGTTDHRLTPVDVPGLTSGVKALALGGVHSCALLQSGAVKCWGDNGDGEVGDGTNQQRNAPVDVTGLSSGVMTLTARRDHNCALLNNGTARCWGANEVGQLGDGTKTSRNQPVSVTAVTANISAIIAGGLHTCVLTTSGGVKCWGGNKDGQLGNNTTTDSLSAVDASGLQSGVTMIATGRNHTCALLPTGRVKCWGLNLDGQIGDNTVNSRSTPVDVLTAGVPTPTFTPTNTPTVTPTPTNTPIPSPTLTPPTPSQLPDLIVSSMGIELETGSSCSYTSTALGVRVTVFNNGDVAAGPFFVAVNGQQKRIDSGLGVKAAATVWIATSVSGQVTADVDATNLIAESNENNNSLTQFLPVPTLPPTCTPTSAPTDTHTPTPTITPPDTSTPTPTTPGNNEPIALYMPLVVRMIPPSVTVTPTAPPTWRLVGQAGLNAAVVLVHDSQLFVGERTGSGLGGGLYRRPLGLCEAAPTFTSITDIKPTSVLGLAFDGTRGVLANYDQGIFFSTNNGMNWRKADKEVKNPGTVAVSARGTFFVGSQDNGVYKSTDDEGRNWQSLAKQPTDINRIRFNEPLLWIGSGKGAWTWSESTEQMVANQDGLTNSKSQQVWDFAFRDATIYIATFDGIYRGDGTTPWQPFGLQGKEFFSIALVGNDLYAGARRDPTQTTAEAGVWRRSLLSGDWVPVTAPSWNPSSIVRYLLYDSTCQGLLAATNDGVWLWK